MTASDEPSIADPPTICTFVSLHGDANVRWIHGTLASRSTGGAVVVVVASAVVVGGAVAGAVVDGAMLVGAGGVVAAGAVVVGGAVADTPAPRTSISPAPAAHRPAMMPVRDSGSMRRG